MLNPHGLKGFLDGFFNLAIFEGDFETIDGAEDVYNIILALLCVISAALASGLTNGLMSFDTMKLQIKSMTGDLQEISSASIILPVIKEHHLVLVTLLLYNALAMEALPIFLGSLVPDWVAVLMSVTLVLMFGEIIPSAIFTGPNQLHLAAKFVPFVKTLVFVLYPFSYPISKALDYLFGHEEDSVSLSKEELEALMKLQRTSEHSDNSSLIGVPTSDSQKNLSTKEVGILTGVLRSSNLAIHDVMLPIDEVYSLSADTLLDENDSVPIRLEAMNILIFLLKSIAALESILEKGFSRIPVYNRKDKQHILGYLLVKSLVIVNPSDRPSLRSIGFRQPIVVSQHIRLLDMLRRFQAARCHMALVSEQPTIAADFMRKGLRPTNDARFIGMVTLEDVIERLIQGDIMDETDHELSPSDVNQYSTNPIRQNKAAVWDWHREGSFQQSPRHRLDSVQKYESSNVLDTSSGDER